MKLSQISTEEAAGVLCELTPFVNDIVSDEELLGELKIAVDKNGGMTRAQMIAVGIERINRITVILLRKKKYSVFGILGVLNGKEADEIGRQNFLATAAQVRDVVRDKALLDFSNRARIWKRKSNPRTYPRPAHGRGFHYLHFAGYHHGAVRSGEIQSVSV